jgi:hypothetical protein
MTYTRSEYISKGKFWLVVDDEGGRGDGHGDEGMIKDDTDLGVWQKAAELYGLTSQFRRLNGRLKALRGESG